MSSLPTETHLPDFNLGSESNIVFLWSGSFLEEISPTFLLYIKILFLEGSFLDSRTVRPSTSKISCSETSCPRVANSPLTLTFLCLIKDSMPLLEPIP